MIQSKGWSHNGVLYDSTALLINESCSFWLLACCKILLCDYEYWETIVTKVHSQTLMAMKSGCKIYTHECYVTLEWPLMLHFKHRMCCPQFVQCVLRK